MKSTTRLYSSTIVAALGGLLFGFDTAVISGTTAALQEYFSLSEAMLGFTVVTALIGTVLGSIAVSRPADIWGRKRVLLILAILYTVSAIGSGLPLISMKSFLEKSEWISYCWGITTLSLEQENSTMLFLVIDQHPRRLSVSIFLRSPTPQFS